MSDTTYILDNDATRNKVRERYGKIARERGSCCAPQGENNSSCCGTEADAKANKLGYTVEDVAASPDSAAITLGCGNPTAMAQLKKGETVVDLGSGAGFDCFIAAKQVGEEGKVIGVDMTPDMISTARKNAVAGGFSQVEFRLGEIEALPVGDNQVDVIMSNCVINLSPDKPAVFRESYRILKSGGRLSIADVVATAEMPAEVKEDFANFTSCIAGAAMVEDVEHMLKDAGFAEVKITTNEDTREMINKWSSIGKPGDYVVSAIIEAVK
ncbi:MAG: arsenite methyltransferase [Opitutales bacterium]|nr:arsenite methyltransferase [Opitutales bacterium]